MGILKAGPSQESESRTVSRVLNEVFTELRILGELPANLQVHKKKMKQGRQSAQGL